MDLYPPTTNLNKYFRKGKRMRELVDYALFHTDYGYDLMIVESEIPRIDNYGNYLKIIWGNNIIIYKDKETYFNVVTLITFMVEGVIRERKAQRKYMLFLIGIILTYLVLMFKL